MNIDLKERPYYIEQILPFVDKTDFIKVLTGVRRCGKSSLLLLLQSELRKRGISADNILSINLESALFADMETSAHLVDYVMLHKPQSGRLYLFVDEIQDIDGWEKGINGLRVDLDIDIFITGSNSKLLSGELATYISGRYVSFEIMPLSFKEYLQFSDSLDSSIIQTRASLDNYLAIGGFPGIVSAGFPQPEAYTALSDLYQSVVLRDVVKRNNVRNIDLLDRLSRYVFDNVGRIFSTNSIVKYLKNEKRSVDAETIYNYFRYLEEAMLITRVSRYDIEGKQHFKVNKKLFPIDHALRHAILGFDPNALSATIENVVFNEIKRRGFRSINIGQLDSREIDFVAKDLPSHPRQTMYIQVTRGIFGEDTIERREFGPLEEVKDNFPKYVVSLRDGGDITAKNNKGIGFVNLADFLLADAW